MSDLISRADAVKAVNTALFPKINTAKDAEKAIEAIPSAQPKTGEWIDRSEGGRVLHPWWESYECNQCGCYGSKAWNFCPSCGARMTERSE